MVIGIDASRANRTQKTGVEWYAWHVINELKHIIPSDMQVRLYTDTPLTGQLATLPANWQERYLRWPPKRLWTQVRLSLDLYLHPVDVLFTPAHVFPLYHPRKTIMTVHDVAALWYPEAFSHFERHYSIWSAKRAVQELWRVIVPSEFTKRELAHVLGKPEHALGHVSVIHHGYDERFTLAKENEAIAETKARFGITGDYLLYLGRLEEKKNVRTLIEAYDHYCQQQRARGNTPPQLVLVGKPGYGYEQVEQALEQSICRSSILTLGWVETQDAVVLMNAAYMFLFPTRYEGFGMPVLEAFASGVPVIASRGNSVEEIGGEACVYVDTAHHVSIANAMTILTDDLEFRKKKILRGLEQVENFSWTTCALETFRTIVGLG